MTDLRQETVDTYNKSAKELAEYFRGIGSRTDDIERGLKLAGNPKIPNILEIGCGDGRDAKEIVKLTSNYKGFDISEGLIKIARKHVPSADFEVADAISYKYPKNLDVVFAFASLLHLDKAEVRLVLDKVHGALKSNGIFYISLKYAAKYREETKEDQFGRRMFYFYKPEIIEGLAGNNYKTLKTWRETHGHTEWFEIALQKI